MNIAIFAFDELTLSRLYDILQLRQRVFIIEQQSIYDDIDCEDANAYHLCVERDNQILGYTRVRVIHEKHLIKIERVVLAKEARGQGIGAQMMEKALLLCEQTASDYRILLSSQHTMVAFYQRYGFVAQGDAYDDGGILHVDMVKQP